MVNESSVIEGIDKLLDNTLIKERYRTSGSIYKMASSHAIVPFFYLYANQHPKFVSDEVKLNLKANFFGNLNRNLRLESELNGLINQFKNTNPLTEIFKLKGFWLIENLYPNKGLRTISDADILLPYPVANQFNSFLSEKGFSPSEVFKRNSENKYRFYRDNHLTQMRKNHLWIEPHYRLFNTTPGHKLDSVFWKEIENGNFGTLHTLFLIDHLGKHLNNNEFRFRWLFDIYFLLSQNNSNNIFDEISKKSKIFGIEKSVTQVLSLCDFYFKTDYLRKTYGRTIVVKPNDQQQIMLLDPQKNSQQQLDGFGNKLKKIPSLRLKLIAIYCELWPTNKYLKARYGITKGFFSFKLKRIATLIKKLR